MSGASGSHVETKSYTKTLLIPVNSESRNLKTFYLFPGILVIDLVSFERNQSRIDFARYVDLESFT